MRVDKFLWAVRVFKTRTLANEACDNGKILCGGAVIKASKEVRLGEVLEVRIGGIKYEYLILNIPSSRVGAALVPNFVENKTSADELEKLMNKRLSANEYRDRGSGRPSKKDRREIEIYKDSLGG